MARPTLSAALELSKPVTWFPPIWAFGCGVVSTGALVEAKWTQVAAGAVLAGPMVCATSQIANEWFDREVDAINEPNRPIPSGRVTGRWPVNFAILWSMVSLIVAISLGPVVTWATIVALTLAWLYSAPPVRLKRNGWLGNSACALCYEGIAWFTGAAVMTSSGWPSSQTIALAALYSVGAHGIMTLNDFKSIDGDRRMGIGSLPAQYGAENAAVLSCIFMALPQVIVIALLMSWDRSEHALLVTGLLSLQVLLMRYFLKNPVERAVLFSALGVSLYCACMLTSALAISTFTGTPS